MTRGPRPPAACYNRRNEPRNSTRPMVGERCNRPTSRDHRSLESASRKANPNNGAPDMGDRGLDPGNGDRRCPSGLARGSVSRSLFRLPLPWSGQRRDPPCPGPRWLSPGIHPRSLWPSGSDGSPPSAGNQTSRRRPLQGSWPLRWKSA